MIKISKTRLKEEMENYMELGLTNAEIAEKLNEKYGADDKSKLNSIKVGKLKKMVGLSGTKPKGKQLFELVDDEELVENAEIIDNGYMESQIEPEEFYSMEADVRDQLNQAIQY